MDLPTYPCPGCRRPVVHVQIPMLNQRFTIEPQPGGGIYLPHPRAGGLVVEYARDLSGHARHECPETPTP